MGNGLIMVNKGRGAGGCEQANLQIGEWATAQSSSTIGDSFKRAHNQNTNLAFDLSTLARCRADSIWVRRDSSHNGSRSGSRFSVTVRAARILFTLRPLAVRVLAVQSMDSIAAYRSDSLQNGCSEASAFNLTVLAVGKAIV